ncbi:MAG: ABC transporter ATP-binding protein [Actinomycetota bacterium]
MRRRLAPLVRIYKVILGVAWEEARGQTAALLAIAAVSGLAGAATGLMTRMVVDRAVAGRAASAIAAGVLFLVLTAISKLIEDLGSVLLESDLGERISQGVEQRLMRVAASAAGLEHLERAEFADRVKLVRDRSFLPYFAFTNLNSLAGQVFGLIAAVVLLGFVHPLLAVLPFAVLPGSALAFRTMRAHYSHWDNAAIEDRLARHYLQLATEPAAAKEVRLFGLGPHLLRRHREVTDAYIRTLFRDQLRRVRVGVLSGAIQGAALAGSIGFLGWLALRGRATLGEVALGVMLTRMAVEQLESAASSASWLAELAFAGERYLWLLEYRPAVEAPPPDRARPAPPALGHGITLEEVTFTYPGTDARVLDRVSLHLPPGSTVALVGENGAGKSSLVKLLCRFYDPTDGRILVDGTDLRDIDLQGWRDRTSVAFQDFVRFQLVAREAVGVGDLPAIEDLERVGASSRHAGADRVIERLPQGFDTQLGRWFEGGIDLSEGEWQRVALARGSMRADPLLIVLDEPTASLDARAEHEVFQRFAGMAHPAGQAAPITVLVSHRFSTVRTADLIVVLHEGRIEEVGSHEALLRREGRYAELFRLQASRYED